MVLITDMAQEQELGCSVGQFFSLHVELEMSLRCQLKYQTGHEINESELDKWVDEGAGEGGWVLGLEMYLPPSQAYR